MNNAELGGAVNILKGRNGTQKVFNISESSGLNILLQIAAFMLSICVFYRSRLQCHNIKRIVECSLISYF